MQYAINVLGAGDDVVFFKTRLQLVKALNKNEATQACVYSFYIYITVV